MLIALFLSRSAFFWRKREEKNISVVVLFVVIFTTFMPLHNVSAQAGGDVPPGYTPVGSSEKSDDTVKQGDSGTETKAEGCTDDVLKKARQDNDISTQSYCAGKQATVTWTDLDGKEYICGRTPGVLDLCTKDNLFDANIATFDGKTFISENGSSRAAKENELATELQNYDELYKAFDNPEANRSQLPGNQTQQGEKILDKITNTSQQSDTGTGVQDPNRTGPEDPGFNPDVLTPEENKLVQRLRALRGFGSNVSDLFNSPMGGGPFDFGSSPFSSPVPNSFQSFSPSQTFTPSDTGFNPNAISQSSPAFDSGFGGNVPSSLTGGALPPSAVDTFFQSPSGSFSSLAPPDVVPKYQSINFQGSVGIGVNPDGSLGFFDSSGKLVPTSQLSPSFVDGFLQTSQTSIFERFGPVGPLGSDFVAELEGIAGSVGSSGFEGSPEVGVNNALKQSIGSSLPQASLGDLDRLDINQLSRINDALINLGPVEANRILGEELLNSSIQDRDESGFTKAVRGVTDFGKAVYEAGRKFGEALGLLEPDPTEGTLTAEDAGFGDADDFSFGDADTSEFGGLQDIASGDNIISSDSVGGLEEGLSAGGDVLGNNVSSDFQDVVGGSLDDPSGVQFEDSEFGDVGNNIDTLVEQSALPELADGTEEQSAIGAFFSELFGINPLTARAPTQTSCLANPSCLEKDAGRAGWYDARLGGINADGNPSRTANGERYSAFSDTMASERLPFNTVAKVCSPSACRYLRVNDTGSFDSARYGYRIADINRGPAEKLGMINSGVVPLEVTPVGIFSDNRTAAAVTQSLNNGLPISSAITAARNSVGGTAVALGVGAIEPNVQIASSQLNPVAVGSVSSSGVPLPTANPIRSGALSFDDRPYSPIVVTNNGIGNELRGDQYLYGGGSNVSITAFGGRGPTVSYDSIGDTGIIGYSPVESPFRAFGGEGQVIGVGNESYGSPYSYGAGAEYLDEFQYGYEPAAGSFGVGNELNITDNPYLYGGGSDVGIDAFGGAGETIIPIENRYGIGSVSELDYGDYLNFSDSPISDDPVSEDDNLSFGDRFRSWVETNLGGTPPSDVVGIDGGGLALEEFIDEGLDDFDPNSGMPDLTSDNFVQPPLPERNPVAGIDGSDFDDGEVRVGESSVDVFQELFDSSNQTGTDFDTDSFTENTEILGAAPSPSAYNRFRSSAIGRVLGLNPGGGDLSEDDGEFSPEGAGVIIRDTTAQGSISDGLDDVSDEDQVPLTLWERFRIAVGGQTPDDQAINAGEGISGTPDNRFIPTDPGLTPQQVAQQQAQEAARTAEEFDDGLAGFVGEGGEEIQNQNQITGERILSTIRDGASDLYERALVAIGGPQESFTGELGDLPETVGANDVLGGGATGDFSDTGGTFDDDPLGERVLAETQGVQGRTLTERLSSFFNQRQGFQDDAGLVRDTNSDDGKSDPLGERGIAGAEGIQKEVSESEKSTTEKVSGLINDSTEKTTARASESTARVVIPPPPAPVLVNDLDAKSLPSNGRVIADNFDPDKESLVLFYHNGHEKNTPEYQNRIARLADEARAQGKNVIFVEAPLTGSSNPTGGYSPKDAQAFLDRTADEVASATGDSRIGEAIRNGGVVVVGFSGGGGPAADAAANGNIRNLKGVIIPDGLYSEAQVDNAIKAVNKGAWLVSTDTGGTTGRYNEILKSKLKEANISSGSILPSELKPGNVVIGSCGGNHEACNYSTVGKVLSSANGSTYAQTLLPKLEAGQSLEKGNAGFSDQTQYGIFEGSNAPGGDPSKIVSPPSVSGGPGGTSTGNSDPFALRDKSGNFVSLDEARKLSVSERSQLEVVSPKIEYDADEEYVTWEGTGKNPGQYLGELETKVNTIRSAAARESAVMADAARRFNTDSDSVLVAYNSNSENSAEYTVMVDETEYRYEPNSDPSAVSKKIADTARVLPMDGTLDLGATSGWGCIRNGGARCHAGKDIYGTGSRLAGESVKVYATTDGVITKSQVHSGYGNVVEILGNDGIKERYAHIAKPVDQYGNPLSVGDKVSKGQQISYVTGSGTQFGNKVNALGGDIKAAEEYFNTKGWGDVAKPHLHFEVIKPSLANSSSAFGINSTINPNTIYPGLTRGTNFTAGSSPDGTFVGNLSNTAPEFQIVKVSGGDIVARTNIASTQPPPRVSYSPETFSVQVVGTKAPVILAPRYPSGPNVAPTFRDLVAGAQDLFGKLASALGGAGGGSGGGSTPQQTAQNTQPPAPPEASTTPRLACANDIAMIDGHGTTTVRWACANGSTSRGIGFETNGSASGQITFTINETSSQNTIQSGIECIRNGAVTTRTCEILVVHPSVNVIANPPRVESGDRAQIIWSSVGTIRSTSACLVFSSEGAITRGGQTGTVETLALTRNTEFGVACQTSSGTSVINKIVVRVSGDGGDPAPAVLNSNSSDPEVASFIEDTQEATSPQFDEVQTASLNEPPSETFLGTDAEGNQVQLCNPEIGITRFTWCLLKNR